MAIWKSWLDPDIPSEERLENLRYYKYAATDKSLVSKYILRHYWNWAVTLFPTWMAPNLITLSGLVLMLLNVGLATAVVPDLRWTEDTPQWIYFSFAAGLWLYSTLDNVDGKQARRTNSSSPLGELFDHGCDAVNCTCVVLLQAAALGLGHSVDALILFLVTVIGFYLSTAEEYHTGVLYLGIVNGPTEGIILTCLAFVWSGFFGAGSWHVPLDKIQGLDWLASLLPEGTDFAKVFVWGQVFFFLVTHCPFCFYSIYKTCRDGPIKHRFAVFGSVLYPITLYSVGVVLWVVSPYSIILSQEHFILFSLTAGIMFGSIASSIILHHLTKSPFPTFFGILGRLWLMAVLVGVVPRILGRPLVSSTAELVVLWVYFAFAVVVYIFWAAGVINAFCRFLGIKCLRIPHGDQRVGSEEGDSLLQAQEEGYNTFHS